MDLKKTLASFLPGIFLFGYTVGTGSVTAMAKAGADYGMSLLWTLLLSCAITFFLIHLYGVFAVVTGETALAAFRRHLHPVVGLFFLVALAANVSGSVIGVMGIIADVCAEWSRSFVEGGIAPIWFAILFVGLVYLLFLDGRTQIFEKVLSVIVGVMSISFIVSFFVLMPPLGDIAAGLIPSLPETAPGSSAFLVIASMVGTTVFSGLFILRPTLVREAGWTLADLKLQRRDALFSGVMMFVVSGAIMAAAAATLNAEGVGLENVSEMLTILEPVAGPVAAGIFAMGIIAAGVSSQFPNVLLLPWLLCDYRSTERDMRRLMYRLIVLGTSLLGLIVPIFHARPIVVMIGSQAFGALILPVTVLCILILGNRESLMGTHRFGPTTNILLVLILAFSVFMSYLGYAGLFETLRAL
jgi:manganese transport protein